MNSKDEKIEKLIEIGRFNCTELLDIQLQTTMTNKVKAIRMFRSNPEGMKKVQEHIENLKRQVMEIAKKIVTTELNENFTEQELDELIAIYSNPIFKRLDLKKLAMQGELEGRKLAKKEWPKMEKILNEMEEQYENKN